MKLLLSQIDCGPCPYLEARDWRISEFSVNRLAPAIYETLLVDGFRRSGSTFYKNRCQSCSRCIPIRLDAQNFENSKTLRRLARLNADVELKLTLPDFSQERYELYIRYKKERHSSPEDRPDSPASYSAFLLSSPLASTMITEYRLPDGRLAATGYIDILPDGISSVYFAFEPELAKRSLGLWSVSRELELARSLGKRWYYLGFWVPGSRKMDYKARFKPFEYASGGQWHFASDRDAAMAEIGAA